MENGIRVRTAEPDDATAIQTVLPEWWGSPLETDMVSRYFLMHFGNTCLIAEQEGTMVGFLIGFLSQTLPDEAYIRLVVVPPEARGAGVGRRLYERFFDIARQNHRPIIRSVTSPSNRNSVAFHTRMGFTLEPQEQEIDGLPIYRDYNGRPGTDRILFVKIL